MKARLRYRYFECIYGAYFTHSSLLLPKKKKKMMIEQQHYHSSTNRGPPHKVNIVKVFMIDNVIQALSLAAVSPDINCIENLSTTIGFWWGVG